MESATSNRETDIYICHSERLHWNKEKHAWDTFNNGTCSGQWEGVVVATGLLDHPHYARRVLKRGMDGPEEVTISSPFLVQPGASGRNSC